MNDRYQIQGGPHDGLLIEAAPGETLAATRKRIHARMRNDDRRPCGRHELSTSKRRYGGRILQGRCWHEGVLGGIWMAELVPLAEVETYFRTRMTGR